MITTTNYGKISNITNDVYLDFKKTVIEKYPYKMTLSFSDIELLDIDKIVIKSLKKDFELNISAVKDLLKILKINHEVVNNFEKNLGFNNTISLLNAVRKSMGLNTKIKYTFYISKDDNTISRISDESFFVPQNCIFDFFERDMNKMQIDNLTFDKSNGYVSIKCRKNNVISLKEISNLEDYIPGAEISLSSHGLFTNEYLLRVICSNGMSQKIDGNSTKLKGLSKKDWLNFTKSFYELDINGGSILNRIKDANNTSMSLNELNNVLKQINKDGDSRLCTILNTKLNYTHTLEKFIDNDIYPSNLKPQVAKNYKTDIKIKDMVDTLTDLGTHPQDYGITTVSDTILLNRVATELLFKPVFDVKCLVNQIF